MLVGRLVLFYVNGNGTLGYNETGGRGLRSPYESGYAAIGQDRRDVLLFHRAPGIWWSQIGKNLASSIYTGVLISQFNSKIQ